MGDRSTPDGALPADDGYTPEMTRGRAVAPVATVAAGIRLTRPAVWVGGALATVVGWDLGLGAGDDQAAATAVAAATATAAVVAASNVYNDLCDRIADTVNRPGRPLPSGRISDRAAQRIVVALACAGLAVSLPLGATMTVATAACLGGGLGYSAVLKRHGSIGHLAVALLFAATLPYGALAGGALASGVVLVATTQVFAFVLLREVLKSVPDVEGDRTAGVRTISTTLGRTGALRVFRGGVPLYCATFTLAAIVDAAPSYYLIAALGAVLPVIVMTWLLRGDPPDVRVRSVLDLSAVVFFTGLVTMMFLP